MSFIRLELKKLITFWNYFWFDSNRDDSLFSLAAFRIGLYSVMLFFYITRAPDVTAFYSDEGLFPRHYAQSLPLMQLHPSILYWIHSAQSLNILHSMLLVCLLFAALGLFTRAATIAGFFLHLMFINRNMSVMFGVDMIATYFMLYFCFANANAHWSLDRVFFKKRINPKSGIFSFASFRLMQIQPCVIYGFSGLEKLKGTRWWNGSALWDVFSMGSMQRWDFSFVAHVPLLLSLAVYVVLAWEIYFPVLIWNSKFKNYMLAFGVLMHIGIGIFMNLPSFGALMICLYTLFLNEQEFRRIFRIFSLKSSRS